jgi:glycosyltransferase involved in cell wall biosynthesis
MVKKKRVLILVENLPVPFDRRVWMEATTLVNEGYQVTVICPKGSYSKSHEILNGVFIYRYFLPSLGGIAGHFLEYGIALPITFLLTLWVFFRHGFDVIQSANPPDFFFLIGIFFKIFGKKYVFDHHDLVPESCLTRWKGWKLKVIYSLCVAAEKATFSTANRVIATNESYKQIAIQRGKIKENHVVVVRSGPRKGLYRRAIPDISLKNGLPYLVCYLGVMGPSDGIDILLYTIQNVVQVRKHEDVYFALIGSGDEQPRMISLCKELGLEKFVRFTGRISDTEVQRYLSTADVCVAPDPKDPLNDLSTMNKIIEYMGMGCPIVSFDLKETRISACDAAVYAEADSPVDFAQKLLDLLDDPQRRRMMSEYGIKRFQSEMAWEYQSIKLIKLYDELLKSF